MKSFFTKDIILYAPSVAEHKRITTYLAYTIQDFQTIQNSILTSSPKLKRYVISVNKYNFFMLADMFNYLLEVLGLPKAGDLTNPLIFPIRNIVKNYIKIKKGILTYARRHNIRLKIREEGNFFPFLEKIQKLASVEEENVLARISGIICNTAFVGPEVVHLDISNACNANCLFCGCHSALISNYPWKSRHWNHARIVWAKFIEIVKDLYDLRAREHIAVCGEGDPSLHPQIMDILRVLKEYQLGTALYSNFIVFSKLQLQQMVDWGVDEIIVNISAGTPSTFSKIKPNQSEDVYNNLIDRLKALRRYQKEMKKNKPVIKIKQVINSLNYHELIKMVEQCHYVEAQNLYIELMHETGPQTRFLLLNPHQLEEFKMLLDKAKHLCNQYGIILDRHIDVQLAGLAEDALQLQWTKNLYRERGCYVGWFFSRIYTNNSIGFCCFPRKIGAIQNYSFRSLWDSDHYNWARIKAKYFNPQDNFIFQDNDLLITNRCNQCGNFNTNQRYYEKLVHYDLLTEARGPYR